jgi:hypothetical protein
MIPHCPKCVTFDRSKYYKIWLGASFITIIVLACTLKSTPDNLAQKQAFLVQKCNLRIGSFF